MQDFDPNAPEGFRQDSTRLACALEPDPQGVRVRLVGELDLATTPELDRVLDGLESAGHNRVLIDLSDLKFMDSTGLGSIARAHRRADVNGHRVALRSGPPQVQRLFEITGMLDRFVFAD